MRPEAKEMNETFNERYIQELSQKKFRSILRSTRTGQIIGNWNTLQTEYGG